MADDALDDAFSRQKQLLVALATSPVLEIAGVVSAGGAGGGRDGGEELWSLLFDLEVWRIAAGELQTQPLSVSRKVTEAELDQYQETIHSYAVLRMKARVGESAFGGYQALLEDIVGVDQSDAELNRAAEELQNPVTVEDTKLGRFTLDRRVDSFTGEAAWGRRRVSLHLSGSADVQDALRTAHALWQGRQEWDRRIHGYAVRELLPLKNENWLAEGEAELSPEEFESRMSLESITVSPDGRFDFWYHDGGLFAGHSIQIGGSLADGPNHADIPG